MVGTLIRLSLRLQRNLLTRSTGALVATILGGLYALGAAVFAITGLAFLRMASHETVAAVLPTAGALIVLAWVVVPPLVTGLDETLDPARFATMSVPMPSLIAGLVLGGAVTPAGILTLLLGLSWVLPTSTTAAGAVFGLLGGILGALLALVLARLVTTALASLATTRLFRESSMAVLFVGLMLLGPLILAASWLFSSPDVAGVASRFVGWTPLGAPWALGADAQGGAWGVLAVRLAITLASLAAAVWLWSRALRRQLAEPSLGTTGPAPGKKGAVKATIFDRLGGGVLGAVAGRSLLSWRRDPRYSLTIIAVPLIIVIVVVQSRMFGEGMGIFWLLFLGFMLGWGMALDVSYDSTAHWVYIAAGVRGKTQLGGRLAGYGIATVAGAALYGVIEGIASADPVRGLANATIVLSTALTSMGLGLVMSGLFVQRTVLPGDSVFSSRGNGLLPMLLQLGGMAVTSLVMAGPLILVRLGQAQDSAGLLAGGIALGLGLGTTAVVVGLWVGARLWEARSTRHLESLIALDHA
ncbi:hypothetical protein [Falsarthrobacter nasiphocae]|uniref:ABC-2 type transport system permease protein n=1 Tax=Falsarthrobacter nasiphocae TaxID=189863 RepID=A0AAE3YIH3_9MICC|nr:hypothetical protein [Falsarthrobacter nasiphocae]MDR6892789.1 ABC-2 type transport system permease protein [Falsarthrobacter nasiphocae]